MGLVADVGREGDVLADGEVWEEDGTLWSVGEIPVVGRDAVERLRLVLWSGKSLSECYL